MVKFHKNWYKNVKLECIMFPEINKRKGAGVCVSQMILEIYTKLKLNLDKYISHGILFYSQ